MNASSKPKAPKLKNWLESASRQLQAAGIASARLDAELILSSVLDRDRTWLIAHDDLELSASDDPWLKATGVEASKLADKLLARRLKREPMAYILGYKEFYGRNFIVTPDVLIPRPDTEAMIELLGPLVKPDQKLIDVGTGSGAIAITSKLEFPVLAVTATDLSPAALKVAESNAHRLQADVSFIQSDLLADINQACHIICANLPYVDESWQTSPETSFEPALALFAAEDGLRLIRQLISQASVRQSAGNYLLIEADPRQHDAIVELAHQHGYSWHQNQEFIIVFKKN
jgi:release factor glutamine methyltransferase